MFRTTSVPEHEALVFPVHYPIGYEFYVEDECKTWLNSRAYMVDGEGIGSHQYDLNANIQDKRKWTGEADAELRNTIVFIPFSVLGFEHHIFHKECDSAEAHSQYTLTCPGILRLLPAGTKTSTSVRKICIASFRKSTEINTGNFERSANLLGQILGINSGWSALGNMTGRGGDQDLQCFSRGTWVEK
jgi:hypothetical protein